MSYMRVDEDPAVEPERVAGQALRHRLNAAVSLPPLQFSFSQHCGFDARSLIPAPRILAAACSLAALCLLQVWFCFLPSAESNRLFYQGSASAAQFAALLLNMVLLTAIFVAGSRLPQHPLTDLAFLAFLFIPANSIRGVLQPLIAKVDLEYWRHAGARGIAAPLRLATLVAAALFVFAMVRYHRQLAVWAARALVFIFPVVPLMCVEAIWTLAHRDLPLSAHPPAKISAAFAAHRVVWIIFDEMDYRLAFEASTHLPEFDRLAHQSFTADHAYPPAGRTLISIPALLSGRFVTHTHAASASDLMVRYQAEPAVRWNTSDTIFQTARDLGWRAAAVGWYFPYNRIFGREIDADQNLTWPASLNPDRPFLQLITDQWRILCEGKTRSLLGKSLSIFQHQRIVTDLVAHGLAKAADPQFNLVFLHLPITHAPFYYDAQTGTDASPPRPISGYLDHLQLADRTLHEIRRVLPTGTTLVVSSDHWNREADLLDGHMDHRVPFVVNFPGDPHELHYSTPFNTILTRRLVTAILSGEIRSGRAAASWLDRERGPLAESPYNTN